MMKWRDRHTLGAFGGVVLVAAALLARGHVYFARVVVDGIGANDVGARIGGISFEGDEPVWMTCHDYRREGADVVWRRSRDGHPEEALSGLRGCPGLVFAWHDRFVLHEDDRLVEAYVGGGERILATGIAAPIVTNRTHIFFVHDGFFVAMPSEGGSAEPLFSEPDGGLVGNVNDEFVVWEDRLRIMRMRLRDRTVILLADLGREDPTQLWTASSIVIASSAVVFSVAEFVDSLAGPPDGGSIWSLPLEGGAPKKLADRQIMPGHLSATRTTVYWIQGQPTFRVTRLDAFGSPQVVGERASLLATNGDDVFWNDGATIRSVGFAW